MADIRKELGATVKRMRLAQRLSQIEFAAKVNASAAVIQRFEQGTKIPSPPILAAIMDQLAIPSWFRERITYAVSPGITTSDVENEFQPPDAHMIEILESIPHSACYMTMPSCDILATNAAYREAHPGLVAGGNAIEWTVLDPRAKEAWPNWRTSAELALSPLRAFGFLDPERSQQVISKCSTSPDWQSLWDAVPPLDRTNGAVIAARDPKSQKVIDRMILVMRPEFPRRSWLLYIAAPMSFRLDQDSGCSHIGSTRSDP